MECESWRTGETERERRYFISILLGEKEEE